MASIAGESPERPEKGLVAKSPSTLSPAARRVAITSMVVTPVATLALWVHFIWLLAYKGPAVEMAAPYAPPGALSLLTWASLLIVGFGILVGIRSLWRP